MTYQWNITSSTWMPVSPERARILDSAGERVKPNPRHKPAPTGGFHAQTEAARMTEKCAAIMAAKRTHDWESNPHAR